MDKLSIKTISLKDLWNVLRGCFIFVLLAAIITTGAMYVRAKMNYSPLYSSTATVYLVGVYEGEFDIQEFANDYNVAFRIIDECVILLQSRTVLTAVGEEVGTSYGAIKSAVTITNPEDTRIINISATASSPERAKQIVDSVCKCGADAMQDLFAYDQFRVFEPGTYNNWPINAVSIMSYAKYGIIAGGLVYIIFLLMFLFDNYIRTDEDIEHYLGISILGEIPDAYASNKRKKKYTNYKEYKVQTNGNVYSSKTDYDGKD